MNKRNVVGYWLIAIFVMAGFTLIMILSNTQVNVGSVAAILLGSVFLIADSDLDLPVGMVFGGAMGIIDWQDGDGLRFWCGALALACLLFAYIVRRNLECDINRL